MYCFLGSRYFDFKRSQINEIGSIKGYSHFLNYHHDDEPQDRMYYILNYVVKFAIFYSMFMIIV